GGSVNVPPLPLPENFPQRLSNGGIVFFPRNFLLKRTVESDQMIISDRAFPGIKFRERFGVGNGRVKNNNGLSRQIFRCIRGGNYEHKRGCECEYLIWGAQAGSLRSPERKSHLKVNFNPS